MPHAKPARSGPLGPDRVQTGADEIDNGVVRVGAAWANRFSFRQLGARRRDAH